MNIAVYGAIAKALNVPMSFPGPYAAYDALYQLTDTRILAAAVEWAGDTESCRGEIFISPMVITSAGPLSGHV